jgi:hypothetical protein
VKILLTCAIVLAWLVLMRANLMGAAKEASRPGVLARTIGWAALGTALGVWALVKVWS